MEKITHENWPESWRDVPPFTEISEETYFRDNITKYDKLADLLHWTPFC